jgi:hypothetical protein
VKEVKIDHVTTPFKGFQVVQGERVFKSRPKFRNKIHNAPNAGLAPFFRVGCLVHFKGELDKLTRNREFE